jgi:hypothetical protein
MSYVIPTGTQDAPELAARLAALWAPAPPNGAVVRDEYDHDQCTGADDCSCSWHMHQHHVRTARCQRTDCARPTRYRLRMWKPNGTTTLQAGELGRGENPDEWLTFSEEPWYLTGSERYACDRDHAYELAELLRLRYATPDDDEATRWRVLIEPHRYEPDGYDLAGTGMVWLQTLGTTIQYGVRQLVDLVNPYAVHPHRDAAYVLDHVRRSAAELAVELARLDTRPVPQARYTDAIPAEVNAVRTAPDGPIVRRRVPTGPTSGWFTLTTHVSYESDDELLAAYPGGLYELGRSELVLPDDTEEQP